VKYVIFFFTFKSTGIEADKQQAAQSTHTWCGYKITGLNFYPLPCKLGNSEWCVVLACALPSIHSYNFKVMRQTVQQ
jgi:hypothetical protein